MQILQFETFLTIAALPQGGQRGLTESRRVQHGKAAGFGEPGVPGLHDDPCAIDIRA
jgi:hypothetical protein